MDRLRQLAALVLAIVLLAPGFARAGVFVGIADQEFASHYRPQQATEWCWASCVEMALSWEGIAVSQESIVARCLGGEVNLGGEPDDMVASTNGIFRTTTGEAVLISGQFLRGAPTPTVLYNHLRRRKPVILLYERADGSGHAVLLTGIEVRIDPDDGVFVEQLHVFDPSLGAGRPDAATVDVLVGYRRIYEPTETGDGIVMIAPGAIDGVVLVDGSVLPPPRPEGGPDAAVTAAGR